MDSLSNNKDEKIDRRFLHLVNHFYRYFLRPITEGLYGFGFIFVLIFFVKRISSPIGMSKALVVDLVDIKLSLTGFFLLFVLCLLDNLNSKTKMIDKSLPV